MRSPGGRPVLTGTAPAKPCPRCGRPIRWVLTGTGRRIAIDLDPDPAGTVVRGEDPGDGTVRARVLTGVEMPAQETAWTRHEATCRARLGPRCRTCRGPMDAGLARSERWTTHPSCDPEHLVHRDI